MSRETSFWREIFLARQKKRRPASALWLKSSCKLHKVTWVENASRQIQVRREEKVHCHRRAIDFRSWLACLTLSALLGNLTA